MIKYTPLTKYESIKYVLDIIVEHCIVSFAQLCDYAHLNDSIAFRAIIDNAELFVAYFDK